MCKVTSEQSTSITILVGDGRVTFENQGTGDDQFYLTLQVDDNTEGVEIVERHITKEYNTGAPRYWLRDFQEVEELAWALTAMAKKLRLIKQKEDQEEA